MPISEQVIGIRGWKGVHSHDEVCTRKRFSSSSSGLSSDDTDSRYRPRFVLQLESGVAVG